MNYKTILLATLAALTFSSCATVDITKTGEGYHSPKPAATVKILKTRPDTKYKEIGVVNVLGFAPRDTAKMHNAIRAKAGPMGADAVIITDEGIIPSGFGHKKYASGVAISY
jgi:hypothetical protein